MHATDRIYWQDIAPDRVKRGSEHDECGGNALAKPLAEASAQFPNSAAPFPLQVLERISASCALPSMVRRFAKADLS
jgi:hypothetical protein